MLVKVQIDKEKEDMEREYRILSDEKSALNSFSYQMSQLNDYRDRTLEDIRRSLDNMGRYVETIYNRPTEDDLKKMSADERNKAVKLLERYDELMLFIHRTSFGDDKEIIQMSRKLGNIYPSHNTWNTDALSEHLKTVAKTEASVLAKRGFDRNSDIDKVVEELDKEMEKLQKDAQFIISQDHYQEIYEYIVDKKRKMNIVGKSIESRIKEFEDTNYVMQYPFDPTRRIPNNELPGKDYGDDDEQISPLLVHLVRLVKLNKK